MSRTILVLLATLLTALPLRAQQTPADLVNPFIGTTNYGAAHPGAVAPMGMVSVTPFNVADYPGNTLNQDDDWCSTPYVKENTILTGFSHVNLSGVGCPDAGSILLMPTTGTLDVDYRSYGSPYAQEEARAGYYKVDLQRYRVRAEMTATQRTGLSRYTFPAGTSHILIHLGHGLSNESGGSIRVVSDTEVEGHRLIGAFCSGAAQSVFPVYFVARFSKPARQVRYWKKQPLLPGPRGQWSQFNGQYKVYDAYQRELAGDDVGTVFTYETTEGEQVEVQMGLSYVSIANARQNLDAEQQGFAFDRVRLQTRDAWNTQLSKIRVEGGRPEDQTLLYTALYHTLLHPSVLQDVNGEYPAFESGKTMRLASGNRLTVFSGWDVYRVVTPLMALLYPKHLDEWVRTMIDMDREAGFLPKWEFGSREFNVMEGDPALAVMADAYMRGIRGYDVEAAYAAMRRQAMTEGKYNRIRPDNDFYSANGYVPFLRPHDASVSQALEYYAADYALAQMARALGRTADYEQLMGRVSGYRKYFDPAYGLLRPVLPDGSFMPGFDPLMGRNFTPVHGFHEGTSWNYSFAVPFDIPGLIRLHGGEKPFVARLEQAFTDSLFDMTNEPDMGYPFYFSFVKGQEWRTHARVRQLLRAHFHNTPGGLPGNDDAGTLSAWQIFAMIGLYPVTPGNPEYVVTSPVFDRVTIALDPAYYGRSELVIEAKNQGEQNVYVNRVDLGGKRHRSYFVGHDELVQAGRLTLHLSPKRP